MFLLRLWLFLIPVLGITPAFVHASSQHSKVAFVIGNSEYNHLPNLKNATNDAKAIARILSELGFTVFLTQNTTAADFKKTLSFVAKQTLKADQIIIYFAGHGQSDKGIASLIPIDAKATSDNSINVAEILGYFKNPFTQKAIILDTCLYIPQNSPKPYSNKAIFPATLHQETALIFATSYGKIAYDGTGSHSLFTGSFLDRLATEKTELIRIIQSVRSDVLKASRSHQMPLTFSTLTRPFHLGAATTLKDRYDTQAHTILQSYSSSGFSNKPLLKNLSESPIK